MFAAIHVADRLQVSNGRVERTLSTELGRPMLSDYHDRLMLLQPPRPQIKGKCRYGGVRYLGRIFLPSFILPNSLRQAAS